MNEYELRITITLLGEEQKRNVCNQHEKNIGSCCSTKKMLYTLSHQAVGFEVQLFFWIDIYSTTHQASMWGTKPTGSMDVVLRFGLRQTDRQTDRQKDKHMEIYMMYIWLVVSTPLKNMSELG